MSDFIIFNTNQSLYPPVFKCSGYGLAELVKDHESPLVLEIGCDVGDTSEFLLSSHPTMRLIGVDPYADYLDWNGNNMVNRQEVMGNTLLRLNRFGERFILNRKYSDDAVEDFEDNSFDMIFIDGLHTYEQVKIDCENYYSKVKDGGVFAGHDFNVIPGVNKAVKEFAAKVGKEILETETDVWYWIK